MSESFLRPSHTCVKKQVYNYFLVNEPHEPMKIQQHYNFLPTRSGDPRVVRPAAENERKNQTNCTATGRTATAPEKLTLKLSIIVSNSHKAVKSIKQHLLTALSRFFRKRVGQNIGRTWHVQGDFLPVVSNSFSNKFTNISFQDEWRLTFVCHIMNDKLKNTRTNTDRRCNERKQTPYSKRYTLRNKVGFRAVQDNFASCDVRKDLFL